MNHNATGYPARYRVQRLLGRGAQGEVFLAEDLAVGEPRALKVLGGLPGAAARHGFEREFETLVNLRHPHLVSAHDFGYLDDGRLYLSMDYCAGGSLADHALPLSRELRDAWLGDLLDALEFLHLQGLLHLDLKPANILFDAHRGDGRPRLRLSDFGLMGRVGDSGRPAGSPGYVAPEVLQGLPADARADLYAVGAIAYEMTTAQGCFEGETREDRLSRQRAGDWDRSMLDRDSEIREVLERLLAPGPDVRPRDVAALRKVFPRWRHADEDAHTLEGALIGRDRELALLLRTLTRDAAQSVRLTGPHGIGRSALLRAAFARLKTGDRRVLLVGRDTGNLERLLDLEPHLQVLLVDEFHQFAPAGLEVLADWRAAHPRAVVCVAYDEALLGAAGRAQLRRVVPSGPSLALEPLPPDAMSALLSRALPGLANPDQQSRLVAASGGRPGVLVDLGRALRDAGGLLGDGDRSRVDERVLEQVCGRPLEDPLATRMMALSSGTRRYLWAAAWVGEELVRSHVGGFEAPFEIPEMLAEPRAWLREAERLRASLAGIIPEGERRRLSAACLELAEGLPPADRAALAASAGNREVESRALLEAARESGSPEAWRRVVHATDPGASRMDSLDEALEAFTQLGGDPVEEAALLARLEGPLTKPQASSLHRRLGWCLLLRGELESAESMLVRAQEESGDDARLAAEALADLGWLRSQGGRHPDPARELYQQGLARVPEWAGSTRSRLLNRLGVLQWQTGEFAASEQNLLAAISEARAVDDLAAERSAWGNLGLLMLDEGRTRPIFQHGEALMQRVVDKGLHGIQRASILHRLAMAHRISFQYREARNEARLALAHAEARGERERINGYLVGLALTERLLGRLEECKALLADFRSLTGGIDRTFATGIAGEVACLEGDAARGFSLLRHVHALRVARKAWSVASNSLCSLLELSALLGDQEEAKTWVQAAREFPAGKLSRRGALMLRLAVCRARSIFEDQAGEVLAEVRALEAALHDTDLEESKLRCDFLVARTSIDLKDHKTAAAALKSAQQRLRHVEAPIETTELEILKGMLAAARGDARSASEIFHSAERRAAVQHILPLESRARSASELLGPERVGEGAHKTTGFLLELARLLNSLGSIDSLLQQFIDLLLEQVPAERCAVFLINHGNDRLELAASRGDGSGFAGTARGISETILREVQEAGITFQASDIAEDAALARQESVVGLRSILCRPLRNDQRIIGSVYLDHSREAGVFTARHRELLRGFSNLLAVAVEQAQIRNTLARAQESLKKENTALREVVEEGARKVHLVCKSPQMARLREDALRVARFRTPVLITGESGTGKECLATLVHTESGRPKRLKCLNCSTVPPGLVDSTFFGIESGMASGVMRQVGIFEENDGGTLFLDEIADLEIALQARLLRILEDGELTTIGGRERRVDVRIISATNRPLMQLVEQGRFREDLYHRLNGLNLAIPPLRERREDILPLADYFVEVLSAEMGLPRPKLAPALRDYLLEYAWPGNVRELRNFIERALVLQGGAILTINSPPGALAAPPKAATKARRKVTPIDPQELVHALEATGGNQTLVGRMFGVTEGTIRNHIKKFALGIKPAARGRRRHSAAAPRNS